MSQPAIRPEDIVTTAFYMIGEYSPNENIDSPAMSLGFKRLNMLLMSFAGDGIYIPFFKELTFTAIPNQAEYIVSDISTVPYDIEGERIISLDFANFIYQDIQYVIDIAPKSELYTLSRVLNLNTFPGKVVLENQPLYSKLIFYPAPDKNYEIHIRGKFYITQFKQNSEIQNVPVYYFKFLEYALARELLNFYPSANWSDRMESDYQEIVTRLLKSNDIDMTVRPSGIFERSGLGRQYPPLGYAP